MKNGLNIVLVILCLGLICCNSNQQLKMKENFDWQGHRGARGLSPENALNSFYKALDLGVNTLEMDVVISKDQKVVLSHEPWFSAEICSHPDGSPVTEAENEKINLYQLNYEEIIKYDCGKRGHPRFPEQVAAQANKPLLTDIINKCDEYAKLKGLKLPNYNIEIKSEPKYYDVYTPQPDVFVSLVMKVIEAAGITKRMNLQSFDTNILEEINKSNPEVKLSYLVENEDGVELNLKKISFKPDIYSVDYKLLKKEDIDLLHQKNVSVIPWTINEVEDMKKMIKFGVDGIITDYPNKISAFK